MLFVFQCYPVIGHFGKFINFGLGTNRSERVKDVSWIIVFLVSCAKNGNIACDSRLDNELPSVRYSSGSSGSFSVIKIWMLYSRTLYPDSGFHVSRSGNTFCRVMRVKG